MIESCDIKLVCDRKIQSPCVLPSATERLKPPFLPSRRGRIRARVFLPDFFGSALGFHYLCTRMKIAEKFKVREMAGEHIIVMPGTYGVDMTRVVSLNSSSLYLWEALQGREFDVDEVARLLTERYEVDAETAERDAKAWVEQLKKCGILA